MVCWGIEDCPNCKAGWLTNVPGNDWRKDDDPVLGINGSDDWCCRTLASRVIGFVEKLGILDWY